MTPSIPRDVTSHGLRATYRRSGDWKEILQKYPVDQGALILNLHDDVSVACPQSSRSNKSGRYAVMSEAISKARTVGEANKAAKAISPHATRNADVIMAVLAGLIDLEVPADE